MKRRTVSVLCVILAAALLAPGAMAASASDFTDVGRHWAYDSIQYVVEEGLFSGTSETTFEPDGSLSRAMFVTIIGRYYEKIFGNLDEVNDGFRDTTPNSWYSKYVYWASDIGIVTGYGNNTFGPDDLITREQSAKVLYEFTNYLHFSTSLSDDSALSGYSDASSISNWARDSVAWAVANGVMNGTSSVTLEPGGVTTRAQCAVLMERYITTYGLSAESWDWSSTTSGQYSTVFSVQADESPYYIVILQNDSDQDISFVFWSGGPISQDAILDEVIIPSNEQRTVSGYCDTDTDFYFSVASPVGSPSMFTMTVLVGAKPFS